MQLHYDEVLLIISENAGRRPPKGESANKTKKYAEVNKSYVCKTMKTYSKVCSNMQVRVRIRVYAGPQGIFACLNHDKDQPCRAGQQSA